MADNDENSERAVWHRIDERTEQMNDRLERVDTRMYRIEDNIEEQDKRIDLIDQRSSQNRTILNAITFGVGSSVAVILTKLGGLLNFKI